MILVALHLKVNYSTKKTDLTSCSTGKQLKYLSWSALVDFSAVSLGCKWWAPSALAESLQTYLWGSDAHVSHCSPPIYRCSNKSACLILWVSLYELFFSHSSNKVLRMLALVCCSDGTDWNITTIIGRIGMKVPICHFEYLSEWFCHEHY